MGAAVLRGARRPPGLAVLHAREVLRNPWVWPAGLALAAVALAFRDQAAAVGLVSVVATAQLILPPLVLVVAAPLLTRRETWAFWAALQRAPGRAFVRAALGIGLGLSLPLAVGAALAALALGLAPAHLGLLLVALAALLAIWTAAAALVSAATLDASRALAIGLAVWAVVTLAYGPAVVGLATALSERPLEGLLIGALLLNPVEMLRVGLLETLQVPVLVGPVAVLLRDLLPGPTLAWGVGGTASGTAILLAAAGVVFGRRDR